MTRIIVAFVQEYLILQSLRLKKNERRQNTQLRNNNNSKQCLRLVHFLGKFLLTIPWCGIEAI